jgi:TolB protein
VSSGKGINGAPAFSPDGRYLAMTLSRTGNPEIFVRDLITGATRQLTNHWAIDTEPAWSPDGKTIYWTSDRGGKPQIYRVSSEGGAAERVTRQGEYNARVSVARNGRDLAVAHGRGNEYRIAVWDLESERMRILTPGVLDESPSFAPNDSMILYATREGDRGVLSAVSADGNVRQRLILSEGDVREPAWSPVIR